MAGFRWISGIEYLRCFERDISRKLTANKITTQNRVGSYVCNGEIRGKRHEI